jgi:GxxExxY protein
MTRRIGLQLAHRGSMLARPSALVHRVIGCAIEVHRHLGPGLLESSYVRCLGYELGRAGIAYEAELPVPLIYRGVNLGCAYRADLVVDRWLLLEVKSVDRLHAVHLAQVISYLKLLKLEQGLLMNFNQRRLTDGLKSVLVNDSRSLPEQEGSSW